MGKCKFCKSQEFDNNHQDLTDTDTDNIASQINSGYSSGHLNNGDKNIYWELKVNVWTD